MKIRKTIAAVTAFTALIVACSGSFPTVLRLPVTEASYDTASDNVWDYEECEDGIKLTEYNGIWYYGLPVEIPAIYDGKEVREVSADIFARHLIQGLRINDTSVRFDGNILEGTDISRIETPDLTFGRRTVKIYADDNKTVTEERYSLAVIRCNIVVGHSEPAILEEPAIWEVPEQALAETGASEGSAQPAEASAESEEEYPEEIVIPAEFAGIPVTSIGERAFSGCMAKKIILPDTIDCMEERAFSNEGSLYGECRITSVNIPKAVKYIPDKCFYNCTGLTDVALHDGIRIISATAFEGTPYQIPEKYADENASSNGISGLKTLGDWIVEEKIRYPDDIEIRAAYYIGSDSELTLPPEEVEGIPVLGWCSGVNILSKNDTVKHLKIAEGTETFPGISSEYLEEVEIPDSITELPASAFYGCSGLESVILPESIKRIGRAAFDNCGDLKEVIITSDSVEIKGQQFRGSSVETLELPGNCTFDRVSMKGEIREVRFRSGDKLVIPDNTFSSVSSLEKVGFSPDIKEIYIGKESFRDTGLTELYLPESVKSIGYGAFRRCGKLKTLKIDGDAALEAYAFSDAVSLEKADIGGRDIAELSFMNCYTLRDIDIDLSRDIPGRAFSDCHSLICINGKEVIGENSHEFEPEFADFISRNFADVGGVGFMSRFTLNSAEYIADTVTTPDMTDMEKAKALHDWLCNNAVYEPEDTSVLRDHVDSSVFMDGVAVCEGYAKTYNLLLHAAGVESCFVDNDIHAWNVVKIDGKWFHIDTTWDDGEVSGNRWFLLSDSQMKASGATHESWRLKCPTELHSFQPAVLPECVTVMGDLDGDGSFTEEDIKKLREDIVSGAVTGIEGDLSFSGRISAGDIAAGLEKLAAGTMGDVNGDGLTDTSDASAVLEKYAAASTGGGSGLTDMTLLLADFNADGTADSADSSLILSYYSTLSTGDTVTAAQFLDDTIT